MSEQTTGPSPGDVVVVRSGSKCMTVGTVTGSSARCHSNEYPEGVMLPLVVLEVVRSAGVASPQPPQRPESQGFRRPEDLR